MFNEQEEWQFHEWFAHLLRDQYYPQPYARKKDGVYIADFTTEWPKFASALTLISALVIAWILYLMFAPLFQMISTRSFNVWNIAFLLPLVFLLLLSLSTFLPNLRYILGNRTIQQADLFLQHSPQRLGQSLRISYKLQSQAKIRTVAARIRCFEQVRKERQRFSWFGIPQVKSQEHQLWQHDLPVNQHATLDTHEMTLTWEVTLPADLPPSFQGSYNALVWRIELEPQLASLGTVSHQYTLDVLPEVLR